MGQEKKQLIVIVPGAGDHVAKEVVVTPGTTARDITCQLGLEGYWVKKPDEDRFYGADEPLYGSVQDGEKLEASSPAIVGLDGRDTFFGRLCRWLANGWRGTGQATGSGQSTERQTNRKGSGARSLSGGVAVVRPSITPGNKC